MYPIDPRNSFAEAKIAQDLAASRLSLKNAQTANQSIKLTVARTRRLVDESREMLQRMPKRPIPPE